MAAISGKNTLPEKALRSGLFALGLRFRLHARGLPGSPDLVFQKYRAVVFVHGCFWHGHNDPNCKLARAPKSRVEFWGPKLARNRERDREVELRLNESGWEALILWECELGDRAGLEQRVRTFLG